MREGRTIRNRAEGTSRQCSMRERVRIENKGRNENKGGNDKGDESDKIR